MNQNGFANIIIAIIVGAIIILGGAYVIVRYSGQPVVPEPKLADQQSGVQQSPTGQSSQQNTATATPQPVQSPKPQSSSPFQPEKQDEGWRGSEKLGVCDEFSADRQRLSYDIQDNKSLGFGYARPRGDVFAQETIQGKQGGYDFTKPDFVVKELQSAGIKMFGTLFPEGIPKIPQTVDLVSFSNYVKAVVDRYNGDGKNDMPGLTTKIIYWQVGIEPFCTKEISGETCYKNFFDLVKTAYETAKSVDASLVVSPGGAAPIYAPIGEEPDQQTSSLFKYFFENGGINYTDFFNFHYFVGVKSHGIKKFIEYWRKYIPASKEIWVSETGSRDVNDKFTISSDADTEARWVKEHIKTAFESGATKVFWCRAEHSFSDMPNVVKALQEFAQQYGGQPSGSPVKRQTQQGGMQENQTQQQPGGMMQGGAGGYCGDGKCDDIEKQTGGCPQDCQ